MKKFNKGDILKSKAGRIVEFIEYTSNACFKGRVVRNTGYETVDFVSSSWKRDGFSKLRWMQGDTVVNNRGTGLTLRVLSDVCMTDNNFSGKVIIGNDSYYADFTGDSWVTSYYDKVGVQEHKKQMKVVKRKNITITGVEREITLAVLIVDGQIRTGYSVRITEDKPNDQLGERIAVGRALSDKTNLSNMEVGEGMDKKFILHAIADNYFTQIERGVLKIKGIKEFKAPREIKWRKNTSLSLKNTPDHDNLVVRTETDVFVDDVRFTAKVISEGNRLFNRGDIFESFNVDKFEHLSF